MTDDRPALINKNNMFFRQLLFLGVLLLLAVVIFKQLSFFIGSFLGAITLYVVFRPVQFRLVDKHNWKPWISSLTIVSVVTLILAGLMFGVFRMIAVEFITIDTSSIVPKVNGTLLKVNDLLPFSIITEDFLAESDWFDTAVTGIINTTYSFIINILLTLVILYFMFSNAKRLEEKVKRYNPIRGECRDVLIDEVTSIIYSNAVGIPVVMLAQGLVAAFIYWLFGLDQVIFWAFITALAGLIPMIGTIIVSVPLGISIIMQGAALKGIMLMLCGLLIIANADNLFRIILNQKITHTHPLIVIFGVIMGIPLFGFWGIIFGPLLISMFLLLIKIYYIEFRLMTPEQARQSKIGCYTPKRPAMRIRKGGTSRKQPSKDATGTVKDNIGNDKAATE